MKKSISCLVLCLLFGWSNAQTRFGVKAGGNLATFTGKSLFEASLKPGYQVGAFAEIKAAEKFLVQVEILYAEQGTKMTDEQQVSEFGFTYKETWKLSYLNIPIMAKYYPVSNFYVEAGPYLGVFLDAKSEFRTKVRSLTMPTVYYEDLSGTDNISENFKSIDFGLNVGLGYDFTSHIFANARYSYGLMNVYDFGGRDRTGVGKMVANNNVMALSVGYKF